MKDLPKYVIIFIVIYVLVIGGGGFFVYWSMGELDAKRAEKGQLINRLRGLTGSEIFPNQQNLKQIQDNKALLENVLNTSKKPLQETRKLFEDVVKADPKDACKVVGISPAELFRKIFETTQQQGLRALAEEQGVKIPEPKDGYWFSFSDYRISQPPQGKTADMGIQLLAVRELSSIALKSGIRDFTYIKRTAVEEEDPSRVSNDENIKSIIGQGPHDLYRVYPFELSVTGDTKALKKIINDIAASPYPFVIRFIEVQNDQDYVPDINTMINEVVAAGDDVPFIVPVAGVKEQITVKLRADLIFWRCFEKQEENAS